MGIVCLTSEHLFHDLRSLSQSSNTCQKGFIRVLLLKDISRIDRALKNDRIGYNLRDSFPVTWSDVVNNSQTLIIGMEWSVSPFFIFFAVLFSDGFVVGFDKFNNRWIWRGQMIFTDLVITFGEGFDWFLIVGSVVHSVDGSVLCLFTAAKQIHFFVCDDSYWVVIHLILYYFLQF